MGPQKIGQGELSGEGHVKAKLEEVWVTSESPKVVVGNVETVRTWVGMLVVA